MITMELKGKNKTEEKEGDKMKETKGKEKKQQRKGKIPRKSPEERLNKSVTASVTEKFKEEVKHEAEKQDESISAFARKSLTDEIYHDLHPEATVEDLVESGHEKRSEIRKKPLVRQGTVIVGENEVSVVQMNKYLKLLKSLSLKPSEQSNPTTDEEFEIKFEKNKTELVRTNQNIWMYITTKWHGDLPAFLADYNAVLKLFATTKAETATFLNQGNNKMAIRFSNGQSTTIFVNSVEKFPEQILDNAVSESAVKISSMDLLTLLKSVEYAQAENENMRNLNGIEFELEGGKLFVIAVDGVRMGYLEYEVKHKKPYKFLINTRSIHTIMDVLAAFKDVEVELQIHTPDRQKRWNKYFDRPFVEFKVGDEVRILTRTVDEEFVDYRRVIPETKDIKAVIEVDAEKLYDAIRSLATFYKNNDTVILSLPKEGTEMTVKATSAAIGSSESKVPIKIKSNEFDDDMRFGFNPVFLMEPLKLWSSYGYEKHPENKVELKFVDPKRPLMMVPAGSTKTFAIIMPVRL